VAVDDLCWHPKESHLLLLADVLSAGISAGRTVADLQSLWDGTWVFGGKEAEFESTQSKIAGKNSL